MFTSTFCILAGSQFLTWHAERPWNKEVSEGQEVYFNETEANDAKSAKEEGLTSGGYLGTVTLRPYQPWWTEAAQ